MRNPNYNNALNDNKRGNDDSSNNELRREIDTSFPLSGGETDEDLREALGDDIRVGTDDDDSKSTDRVSYKDRDEDMTLEDLLDEDVPPRSEWRGF